MTNELTNDRANMNHPLWGLLVDCMRASVGGSSTPKLAKALEIRGWDYAFVGWQDGHSIEKITWPADPAVETQLADIYRAA